MSSACLTGRRGRAAASAAALLLGLLFAAGCRQDMANQPKKLPLTSSSHFDVGRSERPIVKGTVYRGQL